MQTISVLDKRLTIRLNGSGLESVPGEADVPRWSRFTCSGVEEPLELLSRGLM